MDQPQTGRKRRVWAFVMVLSCSRHLFVRPVVAMPLSAWVEAHVAALGFFGGAPRRLVTDNLKASVISPDLYDPKLNRTYAELASLWGAETGIRALTRDSVPSAAAAPAGRRWSKIAMPSLLLATTWT